MMTFFRKNSKASHPAILKKPGDHTLVDLKLDHRLKPVPDSEFEKEGDGPLPLQTIVSTLLANNQDKSTIITTTTVVPTNNNNVDFTYAIGSADQSSSDQVYYRDGDLGLFGCVYQAWKNHWILRTSPDDWWLTVAMRIAKAIDNAAKPHAYNSDKVRELFVSHQGKETIAVELPIHTIYEANYDMLFAGFSQELECRIKVPNYTKAMQNDFTTSGSPHTIASQINLMASMQEFFEYHMACCGCGLRGLEMSGSVADWERLVTKLEEVRKTLKPIEAELDFDRGWFDHVLKVFRNLALTRKNPDDPQVAKFWINILMDTTGTKYVGGGGSMPGRPVEVQAYDGWLVRFLLDEEKVLVEDLQNSKNIRQQLSGFNKVPMKVSLTWCDPPISDQSTLIAGIVGFKLHKGDDGIVTNNENGESVPSVEPNHMWAMLLPPDSPVRIGQNGNA